MNDTGKPDRRGKHQVIAFVAQPLLDMINAARREKHALRIKSAFRSYGDQAHVFAKYSKEPGRAARPGHSEHQLGTAVDLTLSGEVAIAWLAEHAHEYGFTLSYPPYKQRVTGYRAEPWHVRFVGVPLATELHKRGMTLEELFRERPELGESGTCGDCPLPTSRAPCGTVASQGICKGNVLTWCYNGALTKVDCGLSNESCGRISESDNASCVSR